MRAVKVALISSSAILGIIVGYNSQPIQAVKTIPQKTVVAPVATVIDQGQPPPAATPTRKPIKFGKRKQLRVAVIDTGIDPELMNSPFLCTSGHKDFTGTSLKDNHGHGTNISGLIDQYAKDMVIEDGWSKEDVIVEPLNYCQIILKFYDPKQDNANNLKQEIAAIKYAIDMKVDMINISGGGVDRAEIEVKAVKGALDVGIIMVVAAGNERADLAKQPYFPASADSRLHVVGNLDHNLVRAPSSNYGDEVNAWEIGVERVSYNKDPMTGSSQSTAVKTGKLIRQLLLQ